MRPAAPADGPAVRTLILARSTWLEERQLPSWRGSADDVAGQTENSDGSMWVLTDDETGRVIGCTTIQQATPPWGWTAQELDEPADYLYTTVTDPADRTHRPGTLIALWAVDRAAHTGRTWVRRGCVFPGLVRYYESQGFAVVHEVQRTRNRFYLMARKAEVLPEIMTAVRTWEPS
ncbi:GNAT family N-acetyltransferase [Streptomyces sp. LP05-1]|uniref:GNAT family N-acetyltransferase n=1 Tax=Streptomyces pyxinae TaxID=2970734 RepID=A0ABT2CGY3_9ACTN|nr:GNAT family N-acetyltransferase [Streptomyces sp. LP05-1]MCS0636668.1 GNAT family N-acetyltransferase [Streptomyces sp. LP05-1]